MTTEECKSIVQSFLTEVRSGKYTGHAVKYMAAKVQAHQFTSEAPQTVVRTPDDYARHVQDFKTMFGDFTFELTELIAEEDKVYARWIQHGKHMQEFDGYQPTGKQLVEYTSAVYRVEGGKIVEYWLQTDRMGMHMQLERNFGICTTSKNLN